MSEYVLAIDNGTQSVRALVFDLQGNLIAKSQVHIEPYFSKQPGWAEQEPQYFWDNLCKACQTLWVEHDIPKESIKGVGVTTQRNTMINLDKAGEPLRPAFIWLDQRQAKNPPPISPLMKVALKLARVDDLVDYLRYEAESNWIAENQPDIWEKTDKFLFLSGYYHYKLTGNYVDSTAGQIGFVPFDFKKHAWCSPRDPRWQLLNQRPEQMAAISPPGSVLGHISAQAAAETGLPEGLPVVATASDKSCEVLGAGCLTPDVGCISYGTTATINTTNSKFVGPQPMQPAYGAAVPGLYSTEVQIYRGYWMVSWFKEEFGLQEQQIAAERGVAPEMLFDDLLKNVPPGSMGLMLQPYWSPGLRNPGPEGKGSVIGFGDVHTRSHLYRAMLEGLAYELRMGKERLEKRNKVPMTALRVSGGGSQSNGAMQLTADIFGLPAARPHLSETSGLGAAIDVAVGVQAYADFDSAVANMTRLGDVFEPIPENRDLYEELYQRVYTKLYKQVQPLYDEIRDITGYPA